MRPDAFQMVPDSNRKCSTGRFWSTQQLAQGRVTIGRYVRELSAFRGRRLFGSGALSYLAVNGFVTKTGSQVLYWRTEPHTALHHYCRKTGR